MINSGKRAIHYSSVLVTYSHTDRIKHSVNFFGNSFSYASPGLGKHKHALIPLRCP